MKFKQVDVQDVNMFPASFYHQKAGFHYKSIECFILQVFQRFSSIRKHLYLFIK